MTYSRLRYGYAIFYSLLGYALLLFGFFSARSSIFHDLPEILTLTFLFLIAFSFEIVIPNRVDTFALISPFYLLGILILKPLIVIPAFLAMLFLMWKYRSGHRFVFFQFFVVRSVPVVWVSYWVYQRMSGHDFHALSQTPWWAVIAASFSLGLLDTSSIWAYFTLTEKKFSWKYSIHLLFALPFAPAGVLFYLWYVNGGIAGLLLLSLPVAGVLWFIHRFFLESARSKESMAHLNVANELIRFSVDLPSMVERVAKRVEEIQEADGVELFLKRKEGWVLRSVSGTSPWHGDGPPELFFSRLEKVLDREPVVVADERMNELFSWYREAGLYSLLVIPVLSQDSFLGCMICAKGVSGFFYGEHLQFARVLMGQVSSAILGALTLEELKATQAQLVQSEKMAGLGKLAAGVAHEINNPLGAILLNAEFLTDDPADKDALHVIMEATRRCKMIVEGLLNFSRPPKGDPAPFEAAEVIDECILSFRHELDRFPIEIKKEISGNPKIGGRSGELAQVFTNLLSNAKYAILKQKRESGLISVKASEGAQVNVLEVADNGCGIPEQNVSRIFEPFFTTKDVGEGTGLGLAITYALVSSMRGKIEVKSQVGEGTTFRLSFPKP